MIATKIAIMLLGAIVLVALAFSFLRCQTSIGSARIRAIAASALSRPYNDEDKLEHDD